MELSGDRSQIVGVDPEGPDSPIERFDERLEHFEIDPDAAEEQRRRAFSCRLNRPN